MRKIITTILPIMMMLLIASCDDQVESSSGSDSLEKQVDVYTWPDSLDGYLKGDLSDLLLELQGEAPEACPIVDAMHWVKVRDGYWSEPRFPIYAGLNKIYIHIGSPLITNHTTQPNTLLKDLKSEPLAMDAWLEKGYPKADYEYLVSSEFKDAILHYYQSSDLVNCLPASNKNIEVVDSPLHQKLHDFDGMTVSVRPMLHIGKTGESFSIYGRSYRNYWRLINGHVVPASQEKAEEAMSWKPGIFLTNMGKSGTRAFGVLDVQATSYFKYNDYDKVECVTLKGCIDEKLKSKD